MSWFDEWTLEQEKKKKKEEQSKSGAEVLEGWIPGSTYLTGGVPDSGTTPYAAGRQAQEVFAGPVKEEKETDGRTWFQKGAFEDGYQSGDVEKVILGTAVDAGEDALTGVLGMGETALDAAAMLGHQYQTAQFYQNGGWYYVENEQAFRQGQEVAKQAITEFVAKDLYDEAAVAKTIVTKLTPENYDWEKDSVLGEKSDALVQSAGQLAATMGLQAVGVPWWLTSGATTFGAEAENALKEGATFDEAALSATISAGAEILTEKISGGIKLGGKTLDDALAKEISRAISNKYLRTAAKLGLDVFGEGAEEWITEDINRFGQWLTYRSEEELKELLFSEEAMQEKLDAFIGGAALGGISGSVNAARSSAKGIDYASEMTNNEKAVVDKVYNDLVAEAEKNGEVTEKQKAKIYDEVLEMLDEGGFSVDTIEEVLGGKSGEAYNALVQESEEFNKLYETESGKLSEKQKDRLAELKAKNGETPYKTALQAAKDKRGQDVYALAQKDRLAESYNERSRRGKVFEADLSQYDAKQQATIQKAIDSGILNNTNRTHKFVDMIARISADKGVTFDFTNNERLKESGFAIDGKTVSGYVTTDGITLNINSPKALNKVVGHEVTHVLEGTELYTELRNTLFAYAESKGELESRRKALTELYRNMDADIDAELTAELVGEYLFSDTDFISRLSTENRNVFQKVWDEIKYLCKVATAGSKEAKQLEAVRKKFEDAYRAETKNPTAEGGVKYALGQQSTAGAQSQYAYMKPFGDQLADYQNGNFPDRDVLVLGGTPNVLKGIGLAALPMVINQKHIGDALNGTYKGTQQEKLDHTFTTQELATLPEKLADPVAVIFDKRTGKANASESTVDVLVEMTVASGKQVLAAVQIGGNGHINGIRIDTNKVATVHGNTDSIGRLIDAINENAKGNVAVFYINNDKTTKVLKSAGNPIPGSLSDLDGFIYSINDPGSPVKNRIASETESQQFKRWFGDWQNHPENASKVVNTDGTPKVVYHGSYSNFSVFDGNARKHSQSPVATHFFTDNIDVGYSYTGYKEVANPGGHAYKGGIYPVYLNIRNPYVVDFNGRGWSEKVNGMDVNETAQYAKDNGYDGLIVRNVIDEGGNGDQDWNENTTRNPATDYVVFDSKQIKSATDNIGTFDGNNPDIRYSISSADNIAPLPGQVYGKDIMLEGPVREDLEGSEAFPDDYAPLADDPVWGDGEAAQRQAESDAGTVPESDTVQMQASMDRLKELERKRNVLEATLNTMVEKGEFGEEFNKVSAEWTSLLPEIKELKVALRMETTPTKKLVAEIIRGVRSTLGLSNSDVSSLRKIIERYQRGAIQSRDELVEELQKNLGTFTETSRNEELADLKLDIRSRSIKVPDSVRKAIPDFAALRRKSYGKVWFSKNGMDIDVLYKELAENHPGFFNEDATSNPEDQLLKIIELATKEHITKSQVARDAKDIEGAADIIVNDLLDAPLAKSSFEKTIERINNYLDVDKGALVAEYTPKRAEFANKESWISRKAANLYRELKDLKKGIKASPELGQLLDQESDWGNIRAALVNVLHTPGNVVNENSSTEASVRELLNGLYETGRLDLEAEYQEKLTALEKEADEKRKAAETANQRKVKRQELWSWAENLIGDTSGWKDKPLGILYATNTLQRNFRDIVRRPDGSQDIKRADAIFDAIGGEYNRNEAKMKRKINEIKEWYKQQKITKEESYLIQLRGEERYNPAFKNKDGIPSDQYYEAHKDKINLQKVDEVIERARADYEMMHEMQNAVLREYGLKEIEYHQGYFRHLWIKKQPFWARVLNWKVSDDAHPKKDNTAVAGLTESFRPNHKWQSYEQQRKGELTDWDFLKGFNSYVDGAMDIVYHTGDIQKRKAFENYIRYIHSDEDIQEKIDAVFANDLYSADEAQAEIERIMERVKNPLGNFVTDFRTQTNLLAGKKHSLDRGTEQMTNPDVHRVLSNVSSRVSANMVAASASAAMSNFIPIFKSWGEVRPDYTLKALEDFIRSGGQGDGTVEKSTFLTNRLVEIEKLDKSRWDKIGEGAGWLMTAADRISSQTVWRSKYQQNLAKGMSESEAIKDADSFAERLMAGRSRGNQPTLFESKNLIAKMLTAFQLEVNNEYGYLFKDLPIEMRDKGIAKLAAAYMEIFVGSYLYNELSNKLTGRDMAFDPIRILQELIGGMADEEEDDSEDIVKFAENVLEQVPFVGGLVGGGRVPISSALPYDGNVMDAVTGVAEALESGLVSDEGKILGSNEWKSVLSELQNPMWYLLPPMAGGQIRKTVQGSWMYLSELLGKTPTAGSYTDSGALRFTADKDLGSILQAALFGQWASENAQEYIDEGRTPLQEKQLQEFLDVDIPIQEYWEYRDGLKGLETLNEKADYIASLDLPVEKKNILINNIAGRKDPIDLTGYENYENFEEMDFAAQNPKKYAFLQENGITFSEYNSFSAETKEAYSWAAQNPEKYEVAKAVSDSLTVYKRYTKALSALKSDYDEDGKAISGSRKEKAIDYINGLPLEYGERIILFKSQYPSDDTYNYDIVDYLNSRRDLSYEEIVTILEELDFEVDSEGNVTW